MDIDEVLFECEDHMEKSIEYLRSEMRGVRTGRASPALVEFVKVDYYGSQTDLRQLANISVPEPTQLLIKPFDASAMSEIVKAIQASGLGLNPVSEAKQIRLVMPPLSTDRRKQLAQSVKQMGEQAKVAVRNARRDANKHIDQAEKDKAQHVSEDQAADAKDKTQELVKQYEAKVEEMVKAKTNEVMEH